MDGSKPGPGSMWAHEAHEITGMVLVSWSTGTGMMLGGPGDWFHRNWPGD